jgi:RecA/RadA recombinase
MAAAAAPFAAADASAPAPPPPPPTHVVDPTNQPITSLTGLHPSTAHALAARGVRTVRDVLASGVADLAERVGWPPEAAAAAIAAVAAQRAPGFLSALELGRLNADASQSSRVPLGLPGIDAALRGGLPPGLVTEVVGPPGAGKSQLCLQAAAAAAAPRGCGGLASAVLLLDAEGKFSAERLRRFAVERYERECAGQPGAGPESLAARARELRRRAVLVAAEAAEAATKAAEAAAAAAVAAGGGGSASDDAATTAAEVAATFEAAAHAAEATADAAEADALECRSADDAARATTDRVLLLRVTSAEGLERALAELPARAARVSARLVVLDSIAALLRTDSMVSGAGGGGGGFDGGVGGGGAAHPGQLLLRERAEAVGRHAALLKRCAEELRAPVLVTNQVTARPGGAADGGGGGGMGGDDNATAAPSSSSSSVAALGAKWAHAVNVRLALERWPGGRRTALVAKSPLCPPDAWEFRVAEGGLEQVGGPGPLARVERAAHDAPLQQQAPGG